MSKSLHTGKISRILAADQKLSEPHFLMAKGNNSHRKEVKKPKKKVEKPK